MFAGGHQIFKLLRGEVLDYSRVYKASVLNSHHSGTCMKGVLLIYFSIITFN